MTARRARQEDSSIDGSCYCGVLHTLCSCHIVYADPADTIPTKARLTVNPYNHKDPQGGRGEGGRAP